MSHCNESITVQFNGQPLELPAECSITELLQQVAMRTQLVAVEVNRDIVPAAEHAQWRLHSGDVVEAVTLVGGG